MSSSPIQTDVVLIGCGIMSATLGVMLKGLDPKLKIHVIERLDMIAGESSDAWNNAGTGHAALCELNYTPEKSDGSIDISKALKVDEEFELSKQFWAWLARQKRIDPSRFIHSLPHMSFVEGKENQEFLRKRHAAMNAHPLFRGMEFTTERKQIGEWAPLLMKDRTDTDVYAATRSMLGTDVNFGALTRMLFKDLDAQPDTDFHMGCEVRDLDRMDDGLPKLWIIHHALHLRKQHRDWFDEAADYTPLRAHGAKADHIIAYARGHNLVTVAPRFIVTLKDSWDDTHLTLPTSGAWTNELTGESVGSGEILIKDLLQSFPVALLTRA